MTKKYPPKLSCTLPAQDILFGNYNSREPLQKKYQEMEESKVQEMFQQYTLQYNAEFSSQMHLVYFRDAVSHVSRIWYVHQNTGM